MLEREIRIRRISNFNCNIPLQTVILKCCDIFNGAFDSDEAECLCYLVRQNSLLGFPLNVTKLLSLSDLCSVNNNSQANSLESICSGSPTLPPLIATPNKPPSGSNAPPPPRRTLHHPPPSTITKPNNASTQNTAKPSRPEQSNNQELTNAANIWCFFFQFVYFIIHHNIAGMED
ncbi:hypothetical protein L1987_20370 [Smallanthus sonchifolius]|uniref:Uncharacterized protein n=1 Tax=Smallanthus sonchifolius TaxID=185202 RepID=A0ACB9ISU8_9ASTR|nr:hypothetical protein L1987_20370 [Smallanthus sonchifolius]